MKKLITVIILAIVFSCTPEEQCECYRTNYYLNYYGEYIYAGTDRIRECIDDEPLYKLSETWYAEINCKR
jgi:hypothetical protein